MTKVPPPFPPEQLLKAGQTYGGSDEKDGFIYFHVYQELMRSIRLKASLRIKALPEKVPFTGEERQFIINLLKKWGNRKKPLFPKEHLDHTPLLEKAMEAQLLAEWLEYARDGRTITAKYLTIGPEGLKWLQNQKESEDEAQEEWNRLWFDEHNKLAKHQGLSGVYDDLFRIAMEQKEIIPVTSPRMQAKEKLFFQFLIHLLQMHQNGQTLFDWKEIGSKGYTRIGGSKVYDASKEWLLDQLQERSYYSLEEIGFISLGQIIPIYFSGCLMIDNQQLMADPLGCITHLQLQNISAVKSQASYLIITENRSPLVKMALTGWLKENNGFMICSDGHLKKPHKKLIEHLSIQKIPIYGWVDYDPSGIEIASQLEKILGNRIRFVLTTNEKAPNHLGTLQELKDDLTRRQCEKQLIEQEQVLGNPADWDLLFG